MQRDGNLCKSAGVSPTPPGDGNKQTSKIPVSLVRGVSPTPPGDGNFFLQSCGLGDEGASPTPPGDGNITAPTNNALEQGASPTPPGDGNPGFLKVTVRVVKMHPQPLTGTEPQTRHRRYRPRLCLLYDWDMSWNTLRNQHIKGKTAGIST